MAERTFVIGRSHSGEKMYENQVVLIYNIDYPQFATYVAQASIRGINAHYRRQAAALVKEIQENCYMEAARDYLARAREGFPFLPHEFDRDFTVTYDLDCMISLYLDEYCFTGGANGVTVRSSDTWNVRTEGRISLAELFAGDAEYPEMLKAMINEEIARRQAANPGSYFENYPELVEAFFCEESFYMTPEALVIYFQESQIAPHATGIPVFPIPYSMLFILLPNC